MKQLNDSYDIKIHKGGSAAWDANHATLSFLSQYLKAGMKTCETGAGKSTLLFAQKGAFHTAITPSKSEVENIKAIADEMEIDLGQTRFRIGFSQDVLPYLEFNSKLDLVLIDGGHGFPIPQIDFAYLAKNLKIGGKLIIDDIDIWTGDILVKFLKQEKSWHFDGHLRHRTAIFTLKDEFHLKEWCDQDFVQKKSRFSQFSRKAKNALSILLQGKMGEFVKKLEQEKAMTSNDKKD